MKQLIDIVGSIFLIVLLSPIMILVSLLIVILNGFPVLFIQNRPGLNDKIIRVYKFRTMRTGEGSDGERMTTLGSILRKTSIDEFPQLFNVLKGDMSFVGPRPLLEQYLPLYSKRQALRHSVKPGITGWAQVNGRNAIDWDTRLEMDVWYVENQSLLLDCLIIIKTMKKLVSSGDVNAKGSATVEPFKGSNQE